MNLSFHLVSISIFGDDRNLNQFAEICQRANLLLAQNKRILILGIWVKFKSRHVWTGTERIAHTIWANWTSKVDRNINLGWVDWINLDLHNDERVLYRCASLPIRSVCCVQRASYCGDGACCGRLIPGLFWYCWGRWSVLDHARGHAYWSGSYIGVRIFEQIRILGQRGNLKGLWKLSWYIEIPIEVIESPHSKSRKF